MTAAAVAGAVAGAVEVTGAEEEEEVAVAGAAADSPVGSSATSWAGDAAKEIKKRKLHL